VAATLNHRPPSELYLLLRAHAEARWLSQEVVPVLHQLEQDSALSEEELAAALAYLEVLWIEARGRAALTEASFTELDARGANHEVAAANGHQTLHGRARRYHAAARRLRAAAAHRVAELRAFPADLGVRDDASVAADL
jgi:hypothetical protein